MSDATDPVRRSTRSTRVARPIDPPYWESIGFDSTHAMNLANFTYGINNIPHSDAPLPYRHDGDALVPYHEQLLPHWRAFVQWLERDAKDAKSDSVQMLNVCMPKPALDLLIPAVLRFDRLLSLALNNNALDRDGFSAVVAVLKHHSELKELVIAHNEIPDVESAQALSEAMGDHPNIEKARFFSCGLGKDDRVLRTLLDGVRNTQLVDLRTNEIGPSSVTTIASFISANSDVMALDLEGNKLSDDNVPTLVAAMKKNTKLTSLDMLDNEFTVQGREGMIKAVFDTTSLNAVVESNHTCQLRLSKSSRSQMSFGMINLIRMGGGDEVEHEVEMKQANSMSLEEGVVRYKVLRALYETNEDEANEDETNEDETSEGEPLQLGYLNDVPVKCMPRVLELVQEEMWISTGMFTGEPRLNYSTGSVDALGRVFHVVKGWQMPALFEHGISSAKPARSGKAALSATKKRGKRKR